MRNADETRKELARLEREMDETSAHLSALEREFKHVQSQCQHVWGEWKRAYDFRWRECAVCHKDETD